MCLSGVDLVWTSVPDVRADNNQRWLCRLGLGRIDGAIKGAQIVHISDVLNVPPVRRKPCSGVIAEVRAVSPSIVM